MDFEKNRKLLASAALFFLAALACYNYFFWPFTVSDGPTVEQLVRNEYYALEGKNVTLLYVVVRKIDFQARRITVSEAVGKRTIEVILPQNSLRGLNVGDVVAVNGRPDFKNSTEYSGRILRGREVHVYENAWWRPLVSLFALAFVAYFLLKERRLKK